jgi:hypothetical protein
MPEPQTVSLPRPEEGHMNRVLLIGLVWLSISVLAGLVIGRAIHQADLRDEQLSRRSRVNHLPRIRLVPPHHRSPAAGTLFAPDVIQPADGDATHRFRPPRTPPTDEGPPGDPPPG